MLIKDAIELGARKLKDKGFERYLHEVRILLSKVLVQPLEYVIIRADDYYLTKSELDKFTSFITSRSSGTPIAYITEEKEFYGLNFKVNNSVLIPRPETEIIIDEVLSYAKEFCVNNDYIDILDLGTGSGCIAITLAKNLKNAKITAVDISDLALKVARENSIKHIVENKIFFIKSNWTESIINNSLFDVIAVNPPYIDPVDINNGLLAKETLEHEPHLALFADNNGYKAYEDIASSCHKFLKSRGIVILEVGINQTNKVQEIFESNNFVLSKKVKDLAGIDRCLIFKSNKN